MPIRRPPDDDDDREMPPRHGHGHGPGDDVLAQASDLLGYDVVETKIIEANAEFQARIVERLGEAKPDRLIPAEKVFGPLDDD